MLSAPQRHGHSKCIQKPERVYQSRLEPQRPCCCVLTHTSNLARDGFTYERFQVEWLRSGLWPGEARVTHVAHHSHISGVLDGATFPSSPWRVSPLRRRSCPEFSQRDLLAAHNQCTGLCNGREVHHPQSLGGIMTLGPSWPPAADPHPIPTQSSFRY